MRTLRDVVKWLEAAEESEVSMKTICLRAPWTADSEARVVELDEESRLPPDALSDGFEYFLETFVALVSRPGDFVNANPLLRIGVSPAERFC